MERLSPSKLSTFTSCGQKFKYKYVDGLEDPSSPAAATGTLVHSALESLFLLKSHERTLEQALQCLVRADRPEGANLEKAEDLIVNYFDLEDPSLVDCIDTEQDISHAISGGRTMRGIIDRLDRLPDGRLQVVDYKTGKVPADQDLPGKSFGMRFYAELVARHTGEWPTRLVLLYLGTPARLVRPLDKQSIKAANRRITAAWDAIDRGEFKPKPGLECKWCPFTDICPAKA